MPNKKRAKNKVLVLTLMVGRFYLALITYPELHLFYVFTTAEGDCQVNDRQMLYAVGHRDRS